MKTLALLGGLLSAGQVLAEGALMVLPASLAISDSQPRTVSVRNVGDAPLYLNIDVMKVSNPGAQTEQRVPLSEVATPGIIANPGKMTLGPNQSRKITLTPLIEPKKEAVYRLYIVPVRSFDIENAPANKISAPVSLSIGYGVLVRHQPVAGQQIKTWQAICSGKGMTLTNTGTARVLFTQVRAVGNVETKIAIFPDTPLWIGVKEFSAQMEGNGVVVKCV
ncbi:MAG TPA: pilus assembly protein [Scandinavium sp.]|uniref:pilus assembly protein n=1 Tax=Scandinavium sp. TaxID=2830653 RepID=UPI002E3553B4|nr:pilus assembly protein [Scandinavium sp.]HEX4503946.1 pilus assembly protein [Scandinavium sp.]